MSLGKSWNKLGRKGHRHERAQPKGRRHLGFLEHHSDYKQRAKNYHKQQDELQHLRLLASLKNPDEFHSDMVHTKALDGRLWIDKESKIPKERLKIIRDSDHKYVTMNLQHQQNKLKKELHSFHCLDVVNLDQNNINNNKNEKKSNNKKQMMEIVESSNSNNLNKKSLLIATKNKNQKQSDHIIFVNNNQDRLNFNASKYFNTPKVLMKNKSNRLKTSQLANKQIKIDLKDATRLKKQTLLKYWQIQSRINKVENIKKYKHHLNMKRKIQSGDKFLVYKKRSVDSGKIVSKRYKWPKERKR